MARRLSGSGFELRLWNRTRSKAEALGVGEVRETPADAAAEADLVISILTGPQALRAAYLEGAGAVQAAPGQVFAEMSTVGPRAVLELAEVVKARGAFLIDAPVIGSVPAVENGQLQILCGGDSEAVSRARPVLNALGEVREVGPLGSGARLKLVSNAMLAGISELAAELMAAGVASGLPREEVFWALTRQAPYLKARERGYMEGVHEPVMFRLSDMVKDLDLALEMFREAHAETPLTTADREVFGEAAKRAGDLDLSAIVNRFAA
jgi:3-hydroxyisobutyrate dehydrogenase-like beta-hydroxyacid dehydrogenase